MSKSGTYVPIRMPMDLLVPFARQMSLMAYGPATPPADIP
jgi:hypothetical protein